MRMFWMWICVLYWRTWRKVCWRIEMFWHYEAGRAFLKGNKVDFLYCCREEAKWRKRKHDLDSWV